MKKIAAWLLSIAMIITVVSALAEVSAKDHLPQTAVDQVEYPLVFEIDNPDSDTYSWYLESLPKGEAPKGVGVTPSGYFGYLEDVTSKHFALYWDVDFEGDPVVDSKSVPQQLRISKDGDEEIYYKFFVTKRYDKANDVIYDVIDKAAWYPSNTVCSFGPNFRTIKPDFTDLWYMFTPIDLSQDGVQEFELVAGNVYIIGKVYVTVAGDSVTVDYNTVFGKKGHIYTKSEYLSFFPDLASVTTVVPEEIGESPFQFGKQFSIENDLDGDTNVLMFVRNVVTFRDYVTDYDKLTRFWPNIKWRVEKRKAMLALMDQ